MICRYVHQDDDKLLYTLLIASTMYELLFIVIK